MMRSHVTATAANPQRHPPHEKTGPASAALMSLNMLIETEGRNYTAAEYVTWLTETGFRDIKIVQFDAPGANGAVIGDKQ